MPSPEVLAQALFSQDMPSEVRGLCVCGEWDDRVFVCECKQERPSNEGRCVVLTVAESSRWLTVIDPCFVSADNPGHCQGDRSGLCCRSSEADYGWNSGFA